MGKRKTVPFYVDIQGKTAQFAASSMTKKAHERKKKMLQRKGYLVRTRRGGKNEPYNLFARKK